MDAQQLHMINMAASIQTPYRIETLGRYAMMNSIAFRPGELEKLIDNDKKLVDCRSRRRSAILRTSRMVQNIDEGR
jgi:hypothetical protein